jgi:hypothetical protein
MAPLSFHLRHHTWEVELPNFFKNLKKITLSTPFIAGIQGTDVKGSTILCAPYNPSLVKRDGHMTFDNAYWA